MTGKVWAVDFFDGGWLADPAPVTSFALCFPRLDCLIRDRAGCRPDKPLASEEGVERHGNFGGTGKAQIRCAQTSEGRGGGWMLEGLGERKGGMRCHAAGGFSD